MPIVHCFDISWILWWLDYLKSLIGIFDNYANNTLTYGDIKCQNISLIVPVVFTVSSQRHDLLGPHHSGHRVHSWQPENHPQCTAHRKVSKCHSIWIRHPLLKIILVPLIHLKCILSLLKWQLVYQLLTLCYLEFLSLSRILSQWTKNKKNR